jgi:hypothetical protein
MNQGTQGYSLTKKTEGRKSRDTVSLRHWEPRMSIRWQVVENISECARILWSKITKNNLDVLMLKYHNI